MSQYKSQMWNTSGNFRPREGPSRGLLCDCEIFTDLRLQLYWWRVVGWVQGSSSPRWPCQLLHLPSGRNTTPRCVRHPRKCRKIYLHDIYTGAGVDINISTRYLHGGWCRYRHLSNSGAPGSLQSSGGWNAASCALMPKPKYFLESIRPPPEMRSTECIKI